MAKKHWRIALAGIVFVVWQSLHGMAIEADDTVKIDIGNEIGRFPRIKVPDHVRVAADWNKECRRWEERVIVAPFKKKTESERWGKESAGFLSASLDAWKMEPETTPHSDLAKAGAAVLDHGCNDPLIRYFANYWAWWNSESRQEHLTRNIGAGCGYNARDGLAAVDRMDEALNELDKSGAPAAVVLLLTSDLASAYGHEKVGGKQGPYEKRIGRLLPTVLSEGSYTDSEAEIFAGQMLRWNVPITSQLHDAIATVEKSNLPEWAKLTLCGRFHREAAWQSRGSSTANKVSEEGWLGFTQQLKTAEEQLTKSWSLEPHAETACEMLPILLGGRENGEEEALSWLQKGMAQELDYPGLPAQWLWFHRPRWGGSYVQMLAYARACVETHRYDTELTGVFVGALVDVAVDSGAASSEPAKVPAIGDTLISLTKGEINDPSRKASINKWRSLLVTRAWLAGKLDVAKAALNELHGGVLDPAACAELVRFGFGRPEFILDDLSVIGTPAEKAYYAANKAALDNKREEALHQYKAALDAAPKEGRARKYLETRVIAASFEQKLSSADWIPIPLDLGAWEIRAGGSFSNDKDGAIVVKSHPERSGALIFAGDVGLSYELRGSFTAVDKSVALAPFCCAVRGRRDHYLDFLATPNAEGGKFTCLMENQRLPFEDRSHKRITGEALALPENSFLVRSTPSSVTCELNDKEVIPKYGTPLWVSGVSNSYLSHIALISVAGPEGQSVKITKLEVRKLEGADQPKRPQSASGAIGQ